MNDSRRSIMRLVWDSTTTRCWVAWAWVRITDSCCTLPAHNTTTQLDTYQMNMRAEFKLAKFGLQVTETACYHSTWGTTASLSHLLAADDFDCPMLPRMTFLKPTQFWAVNPSAFAAAGPTLWNSLPHDINDCVSLTSFCHKLITIVFYIISMMNFSFQWPLRFLRRSL